MPTSGTCRHRPWRPRLAITVWGIADRRACCVTNTRHPVWQQLRVVGEIVWPPLDQCLARAKGKYSEIPWLPMSRIASTSTNADRLTGLPNTYGRRSADRQLSVGCRIWPSADGTRRTVGGRASTSGRRVPRQGIQPVLRRFPVRHAVSRPHSVGELVLIRSAANAASFLGLYLLRRRLRLLCGLRYRMVSEFPDQSVFYDALQVGPFRALLFHCRIGDEVASMLYLLAKSTDDIIVAIFPFRR